MDIKDIIEQIRLLLQYVTPQLSDEQKSTVPLLFDEWKIEIGYKVGDIVRINDVLFKCITEHKSQEAWSPNAAPSLWTKLLIDPTGETILDWQQPDSTNPYMTGDKVKFEGKIYESIINNNTWSPEDYPAGWKEIEG